MKFPTVVLTLCATQLSAAMVLGFGVDADYYAPTADGYFDYKGTSTQFLGDSESVYQLGMFLEHPVPLLPNVRIEYTPETTFSGSGNSVAFRQLDLTPYYEILDNVVDVDLGISFKVLDGNVRGVQNEEFNEVIPMGYLGIGLQIPGLPVMFSGNLKYFGYDGDNFSDARLKAGWEIGPGFQAQIGYRYESIKITNRFDMTSNLTIEGPFIGIGYSF